MSDFKGRHFAGEIILWAVRWYCKYGISYRELAEMLRERGVFVDHTTLYRWVQLDETYVKVNGKWAYLYRAITKEGNTVDFYLSRTRNQKAAKRFLGKALRSIKDYNHPNTLNTDKDKAYAPAIASLKKEKICLATMKHRQVKYLNNRIESDHGKLKRLINPVRGFQSIKTAYATIKGFEVMRMFRKGQFNIWLYGRDHLAEVRLVENQFIF